MVAVATKQGRNVRSRVANSVTVPVEGHTPLVTSPQQVYNFRTAWVLGTPAPERLNHAVWILMNQETMGWQWHQLDHMQNICTSLQTDNHASTRYLNVYRQDALPDAQPTVSKH